MIPIRPPRWSTAAGLAVALVLVLAPAPRATAQGRDPAATPADLGPQLSIHGFSDVTLRLDRLRPDAGADSTATGFALGQFDLFLVSRLSEGLSFLGETVFEMNEAGESVIDIERVFIKYAWSDYLKVTVGRTHTALGYWNEAFHHGGLLQPTVERPEALAFEDDGGILPVHAVGLELSGRAHAGDWDLDYVGNLANGRGAILDRVQSGDDANRDKAVGVKLSLQHTGAGRLAFGPSIYRDRIPSDPGTPGREGEIAERIVGLHLHYAATRFETLAEGYQVRHQDLATSETRRHGAWYAVLTFGSGVLRPYAGVDRLTVAPGDPFLTADHRDLTRGTLGMRIAVSPFNVIKLEVRHDQRRGETADVLLAQTAFTF